jgi:hypothetical protein
MQFYVRDLSIHGFLLSEEDPGANFPWEPNDDYVLLCHNLVHADTQCVSGMQIVSQPLGWTECIRISA